ncbi:MAG: acetamidase/formamidase family protein [Rhodospirillaceae bacterium]
MMRLGLLAVALIAAAPGNAAEPHFDHYVPLTPQTAVIGNFPAQKAPILTIKSGETVKIDTGGGNRWNEEDPDAWLAAQKIPATTKTNAALAETVKVLAETPRQADIKTGHILVGPIAVDGAMPGDMLEIRILSVVPRIPYGVVSMRPGAGGIPDEVPGPFFKPVMLDLKRNVGVFDKGIEVPLGPFMGVMGLQPPDSDGPNRKSGPPGTFGGNLDCKELVAGTTLYLPVYQKGARFFTGDAHAAQGDGEVTITAIETANTAILQFILHKGVKLATPRAETPTHWITFGLDTNLEEAMKKAIRETNTFLMEREGLDFNHAFALSSIGVNFHVTQVVDETKGIHGMIPKMLFKDKPDTYWNRAK